MSESVAHGESSKTDGSEHHEGSRWPIIGAIGAGTMYLGAALTILAYLTDVFPKLAGWVIAIGGLCVLVVGLVGWLNEAYIHDYWERISKTKHTYEATMVTFLMTDIATFGALFIYYFFIRVKPWPPTKLPDVLSVLLLVNTCALVLSSFTLHFSHIALGKGKRKRFLAFLGLTIVLGAGFVAGQAYEYYDFIADKGFTLTSGLFGSAFFGLTGLHGLHVTLGVILLCILLVRAVRGQYGPDRDSSVSTVSMYWHFVDAVWLLLVAALYLGGSIQS